MRSLKKSKKTTKKKTAEPSFNACGYRNAPVWMNTTARVDLTELPITVTLEAVPAILFDSLMLPDKEVGKTKELVTSRVVLIFERGQK